MIHTDYKTQIKQICSVLQSVHADPQASRSSSTEATPKQHVSAAMTR